MRLVSLTIVLFLFWLALSGHYTPFLVTLGLLISIGCAYVANRMGIADGEGHPNHLILPTLSFYPWLFWEICKSAWTVSKVIIDPKLPVSPTATRVRATQRTSVGLVTYANSITLTPGTVTMRVEGNEIVVHAILREGALDLEAGTMDARVTQFEGSR